MSTLIDNVLTGPSIIYPNGGEIFTNHNIVINWKEPTDALLPNQLTWYEILFTDTYERLKQTQWLQIATIPVGISSFVWNINSRINGIKCRIGIRRVNYKGQRSDISFSADNFSIIETTLPIPSVLEPVENGAYYSPVSIIIDDSVIEKHFSGRAYYKIYYRSESLNIDWTSLFDNIPIGHGKIIWDTSALPTASDYTLKVELVNSYTKSDPLFINNVKINSLNYFLIDTDPPVGKVEVINNSEFIKEKNLTLKLTVYDETTGVDKYRIEQMNLDGTVNHGPYLGLGDISTGLWTVQGGDGIKVIQSRFTDYGGNVLPENENGHFFRTYKSINNTKVSATLSEIDSDGNVNLWIAFGGSSPTLYLNQEFMIGLFYEATSMITYNSVLYLGLKDNISNKGFLKKYFNKTLQSIYEFQSADSIINTMELFDDKIFMGLQDGTLMSFDGTTIAVENSNNLFTKSISYIKTDQNMLYIFLDNSQDMWTMRIGELGEYIFAKITMDN